MSEVLFWIILGIVLTLSIENLLNYVRRPKVIDKKKNDDAIEEQEELEENNPDGTRKIKDEVLEGAFPIKDVKLVMVVREDLKMGKGKIGA